MKAQILSADAKRVIRKSVSPPNRTDSALSSLLSDKMTTVKLTDFTQDIALLHTTIKDATKKKKHSSTSIRSTKSDESPFGAECNFQSTYNSSRRAPRSKGNRPNGLLPVGSQSMTHLNKITIALLINRLNVMGVLQKTWPYGQNNCKYTWRLQLFSTHLIQYQ